MFPYHARTRAARSARACGITVIGLVVLAAAARAAELPAPKILGGSPHYPQPPGTSVVENVLDKNPTSEYASDDQGVETFIDFDFGGPVTIGAFRHWNRSSPEDLIKTSKLVFSDDPAFEDKDPSETIVHTSQTQSVVYRFPPRQARYVRWQVTDISGSIKSNQGARAITFFDEHGTTAMGLRLGPRYGGTTVRLRGASHCRIERNHFRDVGGNALYLEDDVIVSLRAFTRYAGFMTGNVLHRNIYSRTQPGSIPIAVEVERGEDRVVAFCDENLYHGVAGNACRVRQRNWRDASKNRDYTGEEWQRLGFDEGSLVGDPLFVDPSKDDYRLKPESAALKLGFVPIPIEKIGIRAAETDN